MRAYQQVAPIYTEKLGRLGHLTPQVSAPFAGLDGLGDVTLDPSRAANPFGQPFAQPLTLGQLRTDATPAADDTTLGPGGWTAATVIGAGMGGAIVGFVAGKGERDSVYRGGFFSAALAGLGASLGHLRQDQNKIFGMSLLLGSLWTLGWAFRPMYRRGGGLQF